MHASLGASSWASFRRMAHRAQGGKWEEIPHHMFTVTGRRLGGKLRRPWEAGSIARAAAV